MHVLQIKGKMIHCMGAFGHMFPLLTTHVVRFHMEGTETLVLGGGNVSGCLSQWQTQKLHLGSLSIKASCYSLETTIRVNPHCSLCRIQSS